MDQHTACKKQGHGELGPSSHTMTSVKTPPANAKTSTFQPPEWLKRERQKHKASVRMWSSQDFDVWPGRGCTLAHHLGSGEAVSAQAEPTHPLRPSSSTPDPCPAGARRTPTSTKRHASERSEAALFILLPIWRLLRAHRRQNG